MNYHVAYIVDESHSLQEHSILKEGELPINLPGRNYKEVINIKHMSKPEASEALKNGKILLILEQNNHLNNKSAYKPPNRKENSSYVFSFDPVNTEATKIYLWLPARSYADTAHIILYLRAR